MLAMMRRRMHTKTKCLPLSLSCTLAGFFVSALDVVLSVTKSSNAWWA